MNKFQKYRTVWLTLIHLGIWAILFGLPYFMAIGNERLMDGLVRHSWMPLGLYIISFYLNYFILLDRFLFKQKTGAFIITNLILLVVIIVAHDVLRDVFVSDIKPSRFHGGERPAKWFFLAFATLKFSIPVLVAMAVKTTMRWTRIENEKKEAEKIRLESDLQNLKYQLQPHFFFNSLNNIYSLVDINPEDAKKTIHTLGKLMRYLLYETDTEKISLQQEVDFLARYIELMKLRCPTNTEVTYQFPERCAQVEVAPLLFISLIENAFKHGISASMQSVLSFKMELENDVLTFTTINTNVPKSNEDKSGSGVGLENLRRRLELIYQGKHELKTELKEDNFIATLKILLH